MNGYRAIRECLAGLALVAGANAAMGGTDPGWLGLNPSPYLLVPLLIGLRHGFASGLFGGALTAVFVLGAHQLFLGGELLLTLGSSAPALLALPVTGALAGELRSALRRARRVAHRAGLARSMRRGPDQELPPARGQAAPAVASLALREPARESEFRRFVDVACDTVARLGGPSTLLLFTAGAGPLAALDQDQLDDVVIDHLEAGDVVARFDRKDPHIAVLLPMHGGRAAEQLIGDAERAAGGSGSGLRCESYRIDGPGDVEGLWRRLTDAT